MCMKTPPPLPAMTFGSSMTSTVTLFLLASVSFASATTSSLTSCLSAASLSPITSSSSAYTADALAYNHRLSYKPADIVYPLNASQVASAVKCAAAAGVKVAARSGGHSYAANGVGGQDGSLVVDLKHLHSVKVTSSSQTATFGTGIRLGDLALALYNNGKQAMAHGMSCCIIRVTYTDMCSRRNVPLCWNWWSFGLWRVWISVEIVGSCSRRCHQRSSGPRKRYHCHSQCLSEPGRLLRKLILYFPVYRQLNTRRPSAELRPLSA